MPVQRYVVILAYLAKNKTQDTGAQKYRVKPRFTKMPKSTVALKSMVMPTSTAMTKFAMKFTNKFKFKEVKRAYTRA